MRTNSYPRKNQFRKSNWLKIWEKKGYNLKSFKINNIIAADGFTSALGTFDKKNWYTYIKKNFRYIKLKNNSKILEYGCGAGAFLSFWYGKKYDLNGIDYSKELIKKSKKYFPKINFQNGEISKVDSFNKKFDLIFSHSVFHYFNNFQYAKSLVKKMLSKLKDNGYIYILDVPDKDKEQIYKKELIKKIGVREFRKKYGSCSHLFYKKSFFKKVAKKNDLKIKIFNQNFKYYENSKYRYNVIFQKKTK